MTLQLEGAVDTRDQEMAALRRQLAQTDEALRLERIKTGAIEAGVRKLKSATTPLYHALQLIHDQIDAMGIESSASTSGGDSDPRWQSFKNTFPGVPARIIDALLTHREMSITQLSGLLKAHYNTVSNALSSLAKAGAVTKDGGRNGQYRLKGL